MVEKIPKVNVDILVVKVGKILLGLLTKEWSYQGKRVYGVPGRDIRFGEKLAILLKETLRKNLVAML